MKRWKIRIQKSTNRMPVPYWVLFFRGDDVFKKVKVLSGGEKAGWPWSNSCSLLQISCYWMSPPPTWIWQVSTLLSRHSGLLRHPHFRVSHDLHFIRALGKRTIRIEAGKITNFAGDYDYYLWKSGSDDARSGLIEGLRDARPDQEKDLNTGEKALSAKEKRRIRSQERERKKAEKGKLEDTVRKLEKEIMKLEEEQDLVNEQLGNPDSYNDPEKAKELNEQASKLARKTPAKKLRMGDRNRKAPRD